MHIYIYIDVIFPICLNSSLFCQPCLEAESQCLEAEPSLCRSPWHPDVGMFTDTKTGRPKEGVEGKHRENKDYKLYKSFAISPKHSTCGWAHKWFHRTSSRIVAVTIDPASLCSGSCQCILQSSRWRWAGQIFEQEQCLPQLPTLVALPLLNHPAVAGNMKQIDIGTILDIYILIYDQQPSGDAREMSWCTKSNPWISLNHDRCLYQNCLFIFYQISLSWVECQSQIVWTNCHAPQEEKN